MGKVFGVRKWLLVMLITVITVMGMITTHCIKKHGSEGESIDMCYYDKEIYWHSKKISGNISALLISMIAVPWVFKNVDNITKDNEK